MVIYHAEYNPDIDQIKEQVRIEERKRIGEWLDNFPHDSGDGYENIKILEIGGVESLKRGELPSGA